MHLPAASAVGDTKIDGPGENSLPQYGQLLGIKKSDQKEAVPLFSANPLKIFDKDWRYYIYSKKKYLIKLFSKLLLNCYASYDCERPRPIGQYLNKALFTFRIKTVRNFPNAILFF